MVVRRITHLRSLAYLFWGLVVILGGTLAVLVYWPVEPASGTSADSAPSCTPRSPCISLVVDDVGRDLTLLRRLLRQRAPLSLAVLPHARFTTPSVELIREQGQEILVHLPMAPEDRSKISDEALVLGIDGPLETVLQDCLGRVHGAVGFNNHMGSKLTQDVGAMGRLMRMARKRRMEVVLDSRTTLRSVMCEEARRQSIPCLHRDVFLDDPPGAANFLFQLRKVLDRARQRGWAVAIVHLRPDSVALLERFLRNPGVQLVRLTSLAAKAGAGGPRSELI